MTIGISRRSFVTASPVAGVATLFAIHASGADGGDEPTASVYDGFPSQDRALVRETVLVSHFGFDRVRELVEIMQQFVASYLSIA